MLTLRWLSAALALCGAVALALLLAAGSPAAAPAPHADLATVVARPGQALRVSGAVRDAVAVKLQVVTPDGRVRGPYGPFTVTGGRVSATLPAAAIAGLEPTKATGYRLQLGLQALPVTATVARELDGPPAGVVRLEAPPSGPVLENSFVSSVGWVKPGQPYPFTLRVRNYGAEPVDGGTVTVPEPAGTSFTGGPVSWDVGSVPAAGADGAPGERTLVVEARAHGVDEDPQIVWKDLSTTATGTATGAAARSHGPKVIPPSATYDTARYGDRPFPVVPVDFYDRSHDAAHGADELAGKINDPANPGSTFNLYQEMSYGQLFPHATVPSEGIAGADWSYGPGFSFTKTQPGQTCQAPTTNDLPGEVYKTNRARIKDGWYQLPGPTGYYGSDGNGSALIGAVAGVGALQQIDSGCGPTAKAVYDTAQIADPEIDYNDYDTDKDGVVDFFMMVFAGLGGNGDSQLNGAPPYDNIWPHSSTLETSYTDPTTGLKGYISDDQLTDLEGRPLWWSDDSYSQRTTEDKGEELKVHVRVGPYNVNPESAIEHASVISHEYGHSLGLPDFYSTGSRGTYGTWTLMAEDHSQNMDVFGRQELGWVVPRVLEPGQTTQADGFGSSKADTHRIDWRTPTGEAYALQGDDVHNGEAYVAKLPSRQIIDPAKVPSGTHLFWSQAGNDFGCPPTKGHNVDIAVPALADLPAGTPVKLTLKSRWDIEWDFDYGFVLGSTDGGKTYQSFASEKGYTTPKEQNPNATDCQGQYGNGLTGSSASYSAGTQALDRVRGEYGDPGFVDDSYDISALAGKSSVVRFTYATDPGLARAGWFVDDVKITAGDQVVYSSDFEQAEDPAIYNGGCRDGLQTAPRCTKGWQYVSAVDGDPADHAYYLEMRDRSGFDADGHGEDDRGSGPTFEPGLSLVYTDENHGYGNLGTDDPPAQSPLDSQPDDMTADSAAPNLDDAAFKALPGRDRFSDDPASPHVDNYSDPSSSDGKWRFAYGCLGFQVDRMAGDDLPSGASPAPGDLDGDVTFDLGSGCATFDYGYGGGSNAVSVPGVDLTPGK
jgi:immune inhibitor A